MNATDNPGHQPAGVEDRPARLAVGVVGAGRVGPALAAALRLAGHRPVAASGVSDDSRRRAAALLPDVPLVEPAEVLARADLVLLTVPDDTLPGLVAGLAETGAVRPGQLLAHTSGRYGAQVLDPALRAGALPMALHPAMTFTGSTVDVERLVGCPFGVTAPGELRLAAEALVVEMGGEPEWIDGGGQAALPRGAGHRLQPPGHPRRAGPRTAGRRRGRTPRPDARPAAGRRPGQRAAGRRPGADRPGLARRRRHRGRPPGQLRVHSPQTVASYVAMARATADRALTNGMLKPELAEALLDVLADRPDGEAR